MAKPIEPTPTLKGEDAIRFIQRMLEEERNPSPERVKFIKEAMSMKFNVVERTEDQTA